MDNKTWEHTGKGQYVLKDIPYAGYMDGPQKYEKKGKRAPSFIAGFIAGIALVLIIYFAAFRFSNSLSIHSSCAGPGRCRGSARRRRSGSRRRRASTVACCPGRSFSKVIQDHRGILCAGARRGAERSIRR